MSLKAQAAYSVPEETKRIAQACFPHGNQYVQLFDKLGVLFQDSDFADLYPSRGQPALVPVRLALATLLQFAEGLSDREAADAVRSRIDWKYFLCLELTDPGFDHTVLSEFRSRLLTDNAFCRLFNRVLQYCQTHELVKARGRQRTDSTHILAAVSALNRLECVGEAMRHALNSIATFQGDWLRCQRRNEIPQKGRLKNPQFKADTHLICSVVGTSS